MVSFTPQSTTEDSSVRFLQSVARFILIGVIGLLPILLVPSNYVSLEYGKAFILVVGMSVAVVCYCLSFLRSGSITISLPYTLLALWGLVLIAGISAAFSGDIADAVWGDTFAIRSVFGLGVVALVATMSALLGAHRKSVTRLFVVLLAASSLLALWHIAKLFITFDVPLNNLAATTSSPLGSWNDAGLFFGLIVLLTLTAVAQLTMSRLVFIVSLLTTLISLIMVTVVNIRFAWFVLGIASLTVLVLYTTRSKNTTLSLLPQQATTVNRVLLLAGVIFMWSAVFIVGGSAMSSFVTNTTNINYIEVRPSFDVTVSITQSTLNQSIFTGVGPNKFVDAWRQYKNPSINETSFWKTDFTVGYSFLLTSVTELGAFGVVGWALFFVALMWRMTRVFFGNHTIDPHWNFVLLASGIATLYLWMMAAVSVPSMAIVILAAVSTGCFIGASETLLPYKKRVISLQDNKYVGFVSVAGALIIIISTVSIVGVASRQYVSAAQFNRGIATASSYDEATNAIAETIQVWERDGAVRSVAIVALQQMTELAANTTPTAEQQQQFQAATVRGVNAATRAVALDETDPANWRVLGRLYGALSVVGVEGARERAEEAFSNALTHDPHNPSSYVALAQLSLAANDVTAARNYVTEAIKLKRNYTEALALLAQIEITAGNVAEAVVATESIIALEPQNPARYYQLGVLYLAQENLENAVVALSVALNRNSDFADARYLRGLTLADLGETEAAIADLEIVAATNPDNATLQAQLAALRNGESLNPEAASELPSDATEENTGVTNDEPVVVEDAPETDLVTPVNTAPATDDAASEQ